MGEQMANIHLLQTCKQFEAELMNFTALTTLHLLRDKSLCRWEFILVFGADGFKGARASAEASSTLGLVRSTRAILENFLDTELIKLGPDPKQNLADFVEYAYVEQEKLKRLHGQQANITPQDLAAVAKFTDPLTGKVHKHWSKLPNVETRAQRTGHQATYDSFYRWASLATHGASAFALVYKDSKGLISLQDNCLSLAVGLTYGIFENCYSLCNITDPQLTAIKVNLKNIKDQILK